MIEHIPNYGDLFISKSNDVCLDENDKTLYDPEILNKLNVSGLPPHHLPLNNNACIILIHNMNAKEWHVNGTWYIMEDFQPHCIKAWKLNKSRWHNETDIIFMPKIPNMTSDCDFSALFKRIQFPILGEY